MDLTPRRWFSSKFLYGVESLIFKQLNVNTAQNKTKTFKENSIVLII